MVDVKKPRLLDASAFDPTGQKDAAYDPHFGIGDYVKMSIQVDPDESAEGALGGSKWSACRGERPWFTVREKRDDGTWVAECCNSTVLSHLHGITQGDLVEFRPENVILVETGS